MDNTIHIFYPTYKNPQTFSFVLDSCLNQCHEDIIIHVFDNSLCEGSTDLKDICEGKKDARIHYSPNRSNIGAAANYNHIIEKMQTGNLSICMASDMGFSQSGLSRMYQTFERTGAPVVFSSSLTIPYSCLSEKYKEADCETLDILGDKEKQIDELTQSGKDILLEYFTRRNINGEYSYFSFFGALIYSPILASCDKACCAFKYHGYEFYLSMQLAWAAAQITRLRFPCLKNVIGTPRIGGTKRPTDYYTRLEPIAACQIFLEKYYYVLLQQFGSVQPFISSQIDKCKFFEDNYSGYKSEVEEIKRRCEALLR